MPLIPQHIIDQVIHRTDLVQLIGRHVKLKRAGHNYIGLCPFHQEKTPSFNVSADKQVYHCFGCQASGNALNFIMHYEGKSLPEAMAELAQHAGIHLPSASEAKHVSKRNLHQTAAQASVQMINPKQKFYDLLKQVQTFYVEKLEDQQGQLARHYLFNRGMNQQTIEQFGLGYAPAGWDNLLKHFKPEAYENLAKLGLLVLKEPGKGYYDRFRYRLIFPITDEWGQIVGFGGRALSHEQKPKYLNSPESEVFLKSDILYGLYHAKKKHKSLTSLIVVEGYIDLISMVQHGITNVVACLGTAITIQHLQKLFSQCDEIIFAFDGDQAGQQAALRTLYLCLPILRDQLTIRFLLLPEDEDPDSLLLKRGKSYVDKLLHEAPTLATVFFNQLKDHGNLKSHESKVRLAYQIMPTLQSIPGKLIREGFYKQFSELTGIKSLAWGKLPEELPKNQHRLYKGRNTMPASVVTKTNLKTTEVADEPSLALPGALQTIVHLWSHQPLLIKQIAPVIIEGLKQVSAPEHQFLLELAKLITAGNNQPAYLIGHWHGTPYESVLLSAFTMQDLISQGNRLTDELVAADEQENLKLMQHCLARLLRHYLTKKLATLTQELHKEEHKPAYRQLNKILVAIAEF